MQEAQSHRQSPQEANFVDSSLGRKIADRLGGNQIQSTLVISTSVILNNRLSRRENLIPVLT